LSPNIRISKVKTSRYNKKCKI